LFFIDFYSMIVEKVGNITLTYYWPL